MAYLALTFRFGYNDLLMMDHEECIEFVKLADEHHKRQKKSIEQSKVKPGRK